MRDFQNIDPEARRRWHRRMERNSRHGRVWTGVFLLIIGGVALLKSFNVALPAWLFTWQMLMIVIGLFVGVRHGFRHGGWFIPILIGGAFLVNDYMLEGNLRAHIWPMILILVGIVFILRPRRDHPWREHWFEKKNSEMQDSSTLNEESFIDTTSIFGGAKKNVFSKDFKGGDIVNIFGGTQLNLTQADIHGSVPLEITTIFGGTTLIIPGSWTVKSDATIIFGNLEDKRSLPNVSDNPDKILVIKGTVLFGGIEIKSY